MSEEDVQDIEETSEVVNEADKQGFLLKIAVGGITVEDFVKRLNEDDILVAVDGRPYLDGPQRLRNLFQREEG